MSEDLGIVVQPKPTLTFAKCLEMGLDKHIEVITKVAEIAGKEFSIEQVGGLVIFSPINVIISRQYVLYSIVRCRMQLNYLNVTIIDG